MKRQILSLIAILALIQSISVTAREMRAPLPFRNGFQRFEHYPYICENLDKCWDFDVWAGAWHRQAPDAFTHGTKKQSLAGLYFGADSFRLSQILPAGSVVPPELNVLLTPRFSYTDNGAMFGFNINHRMCCGTWDVGTRINIPFRSATVTLDNPLSFVLTATADVVTNDVCLINNPAPERVPNPANPNGDIVPFSYAYRLDCLTPLDQVVNSDGRPEDDLVRFRDAKQLDPNLPPTFHITINDQVVDVNHPVYVVAVENGQTPELPFSLPLATVAALDPLPANGDLAIGDRARFDPAVDYTPLATNAANQHRLWVVPAENGLPGDTGLTTVADNIRGFVTPFINEEEAAILQANVIDFLRQRGISFDTQNLTGAGDLDVDFYARRNFCSECHGEWYVEGITGIRFPTGKRVDNPGLLLEQPLGNNKHFEFKLGGQIGMQPAEWFAFKADAQFYHVFSHTERVGAPFVGATIKNIGPTVDAKVSWNYFLANIDFTFLVPCSKNCSGFNIGYQPYFKLQDKVSFSQPTAVDFQGNVATLNPALIESNTKRHGQRLKFELFHKTCNWEIYGGWLHTIVGKNIQRDSDWYLGFGMFF